MIDVNKNESNYDNSASDIKNPSLDDIFIELCGISLADIKRLDNEMKNPNFSLKSIAEPKPKEDKHIKLNPAQQALAERISIGNLHQLIVNHKDEMLNKYPGNEKYLNRVNKCNYLVEKHKKKKLTLCHSIACIGCYKSYLKKNNKILLQLAPKIKGQSLVNYHITYHIPHNFNDSMEFLTSILNDTIAKFKNQKKWIEFKEEIKYLTNITAKEYSYSFVSGHHPHQHEYNLGRILIPDNKVEYYEDKLNDKFYECYIETLEENNLLISNYSKRKFYDWFSDKRLNEKDDKEHCNGLCLQSDFNDIGYITDINKLYRGFELLDELKAIEPNNTKFKKSDTYSYYFMLSWRNNDEDNNIKNIVKFMEFLNELPKTIDTITYGTVLDNGEEISMLQYFKVGDYANLNDDEIQELKEEQAHQTKISDTKKNLRRKFKKKDFYIPDKLLQYINYRDNLDVLNLNSYLKGIRKDNQDVKYLSSKMFGLNQFQLGFKRGYYSIMKDNRQLVNHEGVDLPLDETDEEILENAYRLCNKFLSDFNE